MKLNYRTKIALGASVLLLAGAGYLASQRANQVPDTTKTIKTVDTTATSSSSSSVTSSSSSTGSFQSLSNPESKGKFEFLGHSYPLKDLNIAGGVNVPATPNVFRWTSGDINKPWYLIEQTSPAGAFIQPLKEGDRISVDGQDYTITSVQRHLSSEDYSATDGSGNTQAKQVYLNNLPKHKLGFQTCDNTEYETLWFAD